MKVFLINTSTEMNLLNAIIIPHMVKVHIVVSSRPKFVLRIAKLQEPLVLPFCSKLSIRVKSVIQLGISSMES